MTPQEHILQLHRESIEVNKYSVTTAHNLNRDIENQFKGQRKFFYELLQNADDAGAGEIEFILVGDVLIVRHTGRQFTSTDVAKICEYGQQEHRDKITNMQQTGYKGVGFKAIFSICSAAQIISGGYSFLFDRDHAQWKAAPKDKPYPWQMIPIWTEGMPLGKDLEKYCDRNKVIFMFKITNVLSLQQDLAAIQNEPDILLFLRHTSIMRINHNHVIQKISNGSIVDLNINEDLFQKWQVQNKTYLIDEKIKSVLQEMGDYECPEKLKKAGTFQLEFAGLLENDAPIASKGRLYNFLPTQVFAGLPFHVNADFLPTTDRTQLQDKAWNHYLIQWIGHLAFEWLQNVSQQHIAFRPHILQWLPLRTVNNLSEKMQHSYQQGFESGSTSYRFIPSVNGLLTTLARCMVDESGLRHDFLNFSYAEKDVAAKELLGTENLTDTTRFTFAFLIESLDSIALHLIAENKKLILFLLHDGRSSHYKAKHDEKHLPHRKFVLTNQAILDAPAKTYFPPQNFTIPTGINIPIIHPSLLQGPEAGQIQAWLESLGTQKCDAISVFEGHVLQLIEKNEINQKNSIAILRFVFLIHKQQLLSDKHIQALHGIKLLTTQGTLKRPSECYLSDRYQPQLQLQHEMSEEDIYITPDYIENDQELEKWREFLCEIGVHQHITAVRVKHSTRGKLEEDFSADLAGYFRGLTNTNDARIAQHSTKPENHEVREFVFVPFMRYLKTKPRYAKHFWQALVNAWQEVEPALESAQYKMSGHGSANIRSPLYYYLRQQANILACDGRYYVAHQLYAPYFQQFLAHKPSAVVQLPDVSMTPEQAEKLGFKTKLDLTDILYILKNMLVYPQASRASIYQETVKQLSHLSLSFEDEQRIKIEASECYLMAVNNEFYLSIKLRYTAQDVPLNSSVWLKRLNELNESQMQTLCKLFIDPNQKIIFNETQAQAQPQPQPQPQEIPNIQRCLMLMVPYIAVIRAHTDNIDIQVVIEDLFKKIHPLQVKQAPVLAIQTGFSHEPISSYMATNALYLRQAPGALTRGIQKSLRNELIKQLRAYLNLKKHEMDLVDYVKEEGHLDPYAQFNEDTLLKDLNEGLQAQNIAAPRLIAAKTILQTIMTEAQVVTNIEAKTPPPQLRQISALEISTGPTISQVSGSTPSTSAAAKNLLPAFNEAGFIPEFTPDALNYDRVRLQKIEPTVLGNNNLPLISTPSLPSASSATASSSSVTAARTLVTPIPVMMSPQGNESVAIGNWGEKTVYNKLKSDYQNKYGVQAIETDTGFKIVVLQHPKSQQKSPLTITVTWMNKNGESGAHYDIQITRQGYKNDERYIEVKSTKSSEKDTVELPRLEWQQMQQSASRYRIFHLYDAGKKEPRIEKIKNPAQQLSDNKIRIEKYILKI